MRTLTVEEQVNVSGGVIAPVVIQIGVAVGAAIGAMIAAGYKVGSDLAASENRVQCER